MTASVNIGILTFHLASNYGAMLQAYALQQTVSELLPDCHASILDVHPRFMGKDVPWYKPRKHAQRQAFMDFAQEFFVKGGNHAITLNECLRNQPFDCLIVGSDQVWNCDITFEAWQDYFFEGVSCRKVAYSASFGSEAPNLSDERAQHIHTLLADFHAISVREHSGIDICRNLGRSDAIQTLDPVLTANPDVFNQLLQKASPVPRTICAVLLDECPHHTHLFTGLKQNLSCDVRVISSKFHPFSSFDRPFVTTVPNYLASLQQAEFVVTDSFHAVNFALLFQKPFAVLPSAKFPQRFGRLGELLSLLGLENRVVRNYDVDAAVSIAHTPVDFTAVQAKINALRTTSRDYLKQALSGLGEN